MLLNAVKGMLKLKEFSTRKSKIYNSVVDIFSTFPQVIKNRCGIFAINVPKTTIIVQNIDYFTHNRGIV